MLYIYMYIYIYEYLLFFSLSHHAHTPHGVPYCPYNSILSDNSLRREYRGARRMPIVTGHAAIGWTEFHRYSKEPKYLHRRLNFRGKYNRLQQKMSFNKQATATFFSHLSTPPHLLIFKEYRFIWVTWWLPFVTEDVASGGDPQTSW